MDDHLLDHRLLNDYQRDFPLEPRPFARIARDLDATETEVVTRLRSLAESGKVGRVGAVVRPNTIGASTLAAMSVPADDLDRIAALVSACPEVNHCYAREHAINLWFVVTAADDTALRRVLGEIEAKAGLAVLDLPIVEPYHIDLGFKLPWT
jgi:DNA-binding Lrp family transcriptional regulator